MQTISATKLARNTWEILDMVANRRESVAIERNRALVAQLVPPQRSMTAAQALQGLSLPLLTRAQATAWLQESRLQDPLA